MAFKELTYGKVWTSAEDFPTYENDEQRVRADMQYHPDAVKDYINNVLLAALKAAGAAAELGASVDGTVSTVQTVLDSHKEALGQLRSDMTELAGGGTPELVKSTPVSFAQDSWIGTASGAVLSVSKSEHKRENGNFGYSIYHLVNGTYRSGTWAAAATRVEYNADGTVTLTADEPYAGKIVFFGL